MSLAPGTHTRRQLIYGGVAEPQGAKYGRKATKVWQEGDYGYIECCYIIYAKRVKNWEHGISCAGGCHYQVSDEYEHLEWCETCEVNYYNCQERHYDS